MFVPVSGTTMKRVNATARRKYSNDSALFLWCESLAASIPERGRRRQVSKSSASVMKWGASGGAAEEWNRCGPDSARVGGGRDMGLEEG